MFCDCVYKTICVFTAYFLFIVYKNIRYYNYYIDDDKLMNVRFIWYNTNNHLYHL